ncbi:MAG: hypothetical protein Q8P35_03310 [Candidatus Yanofskybacteria bacterium]|nr:hypothetical protein [Candidatus Yanofskybacteria bacterium]
MVKVNLEIFKAYDIRGVYPSDFNEQFAEDFGHKLRVGLGVKTIVVGRDGRIASDRLARALIAGLMSAGANVIFLGECSTPVFYFAVNTQSAKAGVMVTASHNPGEYSGFKVVKEKAEIIGGAELKALYEQTQRITNETGNLSEYRAVDEYAQKVVDLAGTVINTTVVGLQAPSIVASILKKIGQKTNLTVTEEIHEATLRVQYDEDGDRISFSEGDNKIPADLIFALVADKMGFKNVVHELRFSRSVRERFQELRVKSSISRVGRLYMYEMMKKTQADFGGELSGHFYFKSFNFLESPELMLLYVRNIIQKEGRNLAELVKMYDMYYRIPEKSFRRNPGALSALEEKYKDGKIDHTDGLTVDYPEWWFNLRLSNTEPVMRLVIEAKTKELLDQKVSELKEILRS